MPHPSQDQDPRPPDDPVGGPAVEPADELRKALGKLAHQINNPLTSLLGRAQLLKMKSGGDEDVLKAAETIEESAMRIRSLIQDLSRLARGGS